MDILFFIYLSKYFHNLLEKNVMIMCLFYSKCVYLIMGGLKDHLGVLREGIWAVSLSLT